MAGYSELHKYLLRLVILPVSVLCAVVAITWFYLYSQEHKHNTHAHQAFLTALLKPAFALYENDPQAFNRLIEAVLAMDAHRAIVLRDRKGEILAEFGNPSEKILHENLSTSSSDEHYSYHVVRTSQYADVDGPGGSIVVQLENYYAQLNSNKAMTGVVLATALCFLVLLYFARQFDLALTSPLLRIQAGIRAFLAGDYNSPIKIQNNSIYAELVGLINSLAASHKSGQENFQENIEQTIQDLKETLESVEIQNIELDLERKNAIQANRAKSEFLTNTSHELKTPLNSIIGFTELLEKTELSQQQSEYLRAIEDAAKGLSSTINDILDFSRLEIGTLTLEHKPVNVRELLEEVIQQLASAATKQNIRLLSIVDQDVPDNLLGDPLRVKQVLTNLISNAIKFTPEGYVLVNISNELISDERYTLRFKVTDSGIGISSGQQDALFSSTAGQIPAPDTRQRSTGSGLGLIIAKGLVERMNGQIEVESSEGKGSTFWFTATFAKNLALKNHQENRIDSLKNIQALIIDRNTMSRMELTHYLRGWGVSLLETPKLENADALCQQHFKANSKNVLILDIESLKQELDNKSLIDNIQKLAQEYEAWCLLVYRVDESKLFKHQVRPDYLTEIHKPVSYQNLYQLFCGRFGVSTQRFYSQGVEEQQINPLSGVRVLAVDDNPANLKLVKELLKDKGVATDTAESGAQAIEYFQNTRYDLILMDVQMPEMDGLATTVKIRELEKEETRIPIVALTAHAANEKKMALLIAGMDDYISKPINGDDLQHIFDRWILRADKNAKQKNAVVEDAADSAEVPLNSSPVSLKLSLEKTQNKPELAKDMLQMLLDSLADMQSAITQYWQSGNLKELQEVVHKLHGGCCYCGVPALTEICARIDGKLQNDNHEDLQADMDLLFARINELNNWAAEIELDELFSPE